MRLASRGLATPDLYYIWSNFITRLFSSNKTYGSLKKILIYEKKVFWIELIKKTKLWD
jgi:hypothetical protein